MLQSKFFPIVHIPNRRHKNASAGNSVGRMHGLSCGLGMDQPLQADRHSYKPPLPGLLLTWLLTLLFFFATPNAYAESNPHAVSLYNLGLSAYKQGSPESAIIFFKRAADIDPDLVDAQYNLGVLYQSERRLKEALPRFEEVLRLKPQDQDTQFQIGLTLIDLERLPEARQHLSAIAPNSPHFAEAQKRIAQMSHSAGANNSPLNESSSTLTTPQTTPQATGTALDTGSTSSPALGESTSQQSTTVAPPQSPSSVAPPVTPPNPQPLIANTSVRVVATGFSAPAGLAIDKQGNIYVANFLSSSIDRVSPDGIKSPFASGINLKGPIGLTIDDAGNLYVANYLAGTISRITPAGISSVIVAGFKKPYYLAIDHDGNLLVSQQEDNSVVVITLPKTITANPH